MSLGASGFVGGVVSGTARSSQIGDVLPTRSVSFGTGTSYPKYRRLSGPDRLARDNRAGMVAAQLARLVPLSKRRFARRLKTAIDEAERTGDGFYLTRFAAQRALGSSLVIDVDPRRLAHKLPDRLEAQGKSLWIGDRFLAAGDWRDLITPTAKTPVSREVLEIVAADFDFRATAQFKSALARVKAGKRVRRNFRTLASEDAITDYFASVAETARSIAAQGVVGRRQFRRSFRQVLRYRQVRPIWLELFEADIGVAVAADGSLVRFGCGAHRTGAAIALGLESIPVEVRMVHVARLRQWMDIHRCGPLPALLQGIASLGHVAKS